MLFQLPELQTSQACWSVTLTVTFFDSGNSLLRQPLVSLLTSGEHSSEGEGQHPDSSRWLWGQVLSSMTTSSSGAVAGNTWNMALSLCPLLLRDIHAGTVRAGKGSRAAGTGTLCEGQELLVLQCLPNISWLNAGGRHWGVLTTAGICKFRKCFPVSSGTRTQWDTPPESETTPSCGWCGHRAHRSGRNWMIRAQPRGRRHTGR